MIKNYPGQAPSEILETKFWDRRLCSFATIYFEDDPHGANKKPTQDGNIRALRCRGAFRKPGSGAARFSVLENF